MHDNSFISGVLYINANREEDAIMFISGRGHAIRLTTDNYNIFNSETWKVPVHTGDLLLFPSRLVHQVEATSTDRTITRVSLAFNTFIHGEIGDKKSRIHLVLR
jgi:ectoine hydroxylase-related dioxygenase (phytanoyl-CoA dioxygenase family)